MTRLLRAMLILLAALAAAALPAMAKPRVLVLTDIENEPDDAESMVRFLVYANQFDVEGLVATTSTHMRAKVSPERIREIVRAYGRVRGNLLLHEPGYPEAGKLLALVSEGRPVFGMAAVGKGMDSPGSEAIIAAADRADPRPLWVLAWGGPNTLAQALWKVRATRSPAALAKFVAKLRVYTISDQDDSGPWLRATFPKLFYIASPGVHAGGAYHQSTWSGISGDRFHGRFAGGDFSLVDKPWLAANVQSKGPLGAQYPTPEFMMEGDTPSFLYLIDNGLGSPEHPDWGSWGGRYELYQPRTEKWFLKPETRPLWTNAHDEVLGHDGQWHTGHQETIWRWREAYQHDFAARMDWTVKPFAAANHPPRVKLAKDRFVARAGGRIALEASASDPDGDALGYRWFHYGEPGSFVLSTGSTGAPLKIDGADLARASFVVPANKEFPTGTMHLIVAVTDRGSPSLTRYARAIVEVRP
jgi:hypothetical protein